MAKKYLDYNGLKHYDEKLKEHLSSLLGSNYNIAGDAVNVKSYIDSRIFVGTAAEIDYAKRQKLIDETTFTMTYDPEAEEMADISDNDINDMFK